MKTNQQADNQNEFDSFIELLERRSISFKDDPDQRFSHEQLRELVNVMAEGILRVGLVVRKLAESCADRTLSPHPSSLPQRDSLDGEA